MRCITGQAGKEKQMQDKVRESKQGITLSRLIECTWEDYFAAHLGRSWRASSEESTMSLGFVAFISWRNKDV